jgi:UDP-glucose:(heptosyl)LPS alpha-1,3-glucosyltransferase
VFAERVCFPRARALVAVSTGVAAEVRDAFPAIASRVTVIPNGVDAERFRPGDRARTELRAVFVGSEWDGKGLAIVIEALRGAPGWHLDVLGTGDRPRFEHLAAEAGVASRVTFWGEQPAPERFYGAASAFVLPSVYETFSLVTYEAAAAGVPLLATRVSGVEDLLQDGVNGWFIDRDSATIAARLQTLADDPARAAAMSAAARQAALRFDWERMVVGFRSLYDDLRPTR